LLCVLVEPKIWATEYICNRENQIYFNSSPILTSDLAPQREEKLKKEEK
jgi:hypothetical protein